jgi:hypothetical protein
MWIWTGNSRAWRSRFRSEARLCGNIKEKKKHQADPWVRLVLGWVGLGWFRFVSFRLVSPGLLFQSLAAQGAAASTTRKYLKPAICNALNSRPSGR